MVKINHFGFVVCIYDYQRVTNHVTKDLVTTMYCQTVHRKRLTVIRPNSSINNSGHMQIWFLLGSIIQSHMWYILIVFCTGWGKAPNLCSVWPLEICRYLSYLIVMFYWTACRANIFIIVVTPLGSNYVSCLNRKTMLMLDPEPVSPDLSCTPYITC